MIPDMLERHAPAHPVRRLVRWLLIAVFAGLLLRLLVRWAAL